MFSVVQHIKLIACNAYIIFQWFHYDLFQKLGIYGERFIACLPDLLTSY